MRNMPTQAWAWHPSGHYTGMINVLTAPLTPRGPAPGPRSQRSRLPPSGPPPGERRRSHPAGAQSCARLRGPRRAENAIEHHAAAPPLNRTYRIHEKTPRRADKLSIESIAHKTDGRGEQGQPRLVGARGWFNLARTMVASCVRETQVVESVLQTAVVSSLRFARKGPEHIGAPWQSGWLRDRPGGLSDVAVSGEIGRAVANPSPSHRGLGRFRRRAWSAQL